MPQSGCEFTYTGVLNCGTTSALAVELTPQFVSAIHLKIGQPHTANINHQLLVAFGSGAAQLRAALARGVVPVTRWGNLQHLADRLDPIGVTVTINKLSQDLNRRSSSACAKNALASFRISLALRSSLTSRSRSLMRCCSPLVTPGRSPAST